MMNDHIKNKFIKIFERTKNLNNTVHFAANVNSMHSVTEWCRSPGPGGGPRGKREKKVSSSRNGLLCQGLEACSSLLGGGGI